MKRITLADCKLDIFSIFYVRNLTMYIELVNLNCFMKKQFKIPLHFYIL